jgi:molecular chaperone GrpE (heat shock protein)
MASALERFHGRAEQYEAVIRRMQSRIEELQADQVRELLKPVIVKLAALHTEATEAEVRASTRGDDSVRKDFDYFVSEIEDALGLLDIESINVSELDEFDASRHAAHRRIDTDDPSLDRRVAKVFRQGFTYVGAERVLVPAKVTVYRHNPAAPSDLDALSSNPEPAN